VSTWEFNPAPIGYYAVVLCVECGRDINSSEDAWYRDGRFMCDECHGKVTS